MRRAAFAGLTPGQRRDAQRATRARAAELGIACLHECGGPHIDGEDDFASLLALAREEPGPRVLGYWGELPSRAASSGPGRWVPSAPAATCSPTARSAVAPPACTSGYTDADTTGYAYVDAAQVAAHVAACTRAGLQAGFHAIGDAALTAVLDGCAAAAEEVGAAAFRAARHRVEHVEVPLPRHVPRWPGSG